MVPDALLHSCLSITANGHVTNLRKRVVKFLKLPVKELTETKASEFTKAFLVCERTCQSFFLYFHAFVAFRHRVIINK